MPELPEVETVRRILDEQLKGDVIQSVDIRYQSIVKSDQDEFTTKLVNQTIDGFSRMGKYLIMNLDYYDVIIHLRMEGKFFIKHHEEISSHEHIIFHLKSGKELRYHDVRKFGTMHLKTKETTFSTYPLNALGKEPEAITEVEFYQKIKHKKATIKSILLDQHVISGLGNIYADETLFAAKIHPTRLGCNITNEESNSILHAAKHILYEAVLLGGTTIRSYTSQLGVTGLFQTKLNVHLKKGKPCPVCHHEIQKIRVAGRGTYVCESCQT